MATDYDAPRVRPEDDGEDTDSLEALRGTGAKREAATKVDDEANLGEDLELPGADLSGEVLSVLVVPQRPDEFTCERCFLVLHVSQRERTDRDRCRDCA